MDINLNSSCIPLISGTNFFLKTQLTDKVISLNSADPIIVTILPESLSKVKY